MDYKKYGYFDDGAREFVITEAATPFPWINYLGTTDFFGLISNTAGGYSFYRDAKFRRLTRYRYNGVPMDSGGRYFYIVDGTTVWNPGWKPCKTPLDFYECRHGMGYTRLTGRKNDIEASVLFFVPLATNAEVQRLTLTNLSGETRHLKLFSLVEWCLWNAAADMENFQRNFSTGEVEIDGSIIYHKTEYKERRNHYAYYSVNVPVDGFDTDREHFLGLYNGFDAPQQVLEGRAANSVAHGWSPIASHFIKATLQPGEQRDFVFVLGYAENAPSEKFSALDIERKHRGELISSQDSDVTLLNKRQALLTVERFKDAGAVEDAFRQLRGYWDRLLSRFNVKSDDHRLNRMVNIWNQYQCMVTFCFSRSASFFESGIGRGMGFRDSNQDLAGFVHLIPDRARQRILDIAATQFADGSCYHQYQPLTRRGNNDIGSSFNDDPLWLIFGTTAYLKETADYAILDEMVPFDNEPGTEQTLFEHLRRSLWHVVDNLGPHGLPLIGRADWNDCLNLNCFSSNPDESFQTTENKTEGSAAESLMIAGLFVVCGRQFVELCQQLANLAPRSPKNISRSSLPAPRSPKNSSPLLEDDLRSLARQAETHVQKMVLAVKHHGWDGDWYLRAYDFFGNKIGSHECDEGKLFIESQGWCAMAGIGREEGMVDKALDACRQHLDTPHGMVLCWPPFTHYHKEMGELSSYPAGYKENAGIFCHNNPWIVIAEALAGRGDDAWELYTKTAPAWITDQTLHKVEPYVYAQMMAGRDAARPGEGKNSWLTGTAAWNWVAVSQYILGIRPTYDGLIIAPSLPPSLRHYTVQRQWREATYIIHVTNNSLSRHPSVSIDGKNLPIPAPRSPKNNSRSPLPAPRSPKNNSRTPAPPHLRTPENSLPEILIPYLPGHHVVQVTL